jgi:hypothetical protein
MQKMAVDPDDSIEADFIRWLVVMKEPFVELSKKNIDKNMLKIEKYRILYEKILQDCSCHFEEAQEKDWVDAIMDKKINTEKARPHFLHTVQQMIDRHWMEEREKIRQEIFQSKEDEGKVYELAKAFDALKRKRPQIKGAEEFFHGE